MRTPCNPLCLDLLMWAVSNRANLFRKVKLLDSGHVVAATPIAKNDIVCYIPSSLVMSIDKLKDIHSTFHSSSPLQFGSFLTVETVGAEMPSYGNKNNDIDGKSSNSSWWPGMTRGHFALLSLMTTLKFNVDGKGGGHAAHLSLLTTQEDVLLESEIVDTAAEAVDAPQFALAAEPIQRATHKDMDEIRREMLDCFVAFERRSVVLYSSKNSSATGGEARTDSTFGLSSFESSPLVQAAARGEDNGVVRGLVPIIDLCTHQSQNPSCTIGFPDTEICNWLAMERGVKAPSKDAVLLQASRDIAEDEPLTVDRGVMMGFSEEETEEMFQKWFGHRY